MRITVLGTSSPYPRPGDPCSSFLLHTGGAHVWVDPGAATLPALLSHCRLDDVDAVWVSHTHADHFSDLAVTYYALRYADISRPPLPVFGPPGWIERLRGFLTHSEPSPLEDAFVVHEHADGATAAIGDVQITAVGMRHDAPCWGFRARHDDITVSYTGDTAVCPGLATVAADATVLISEAGYGVGRPEPEPGHLTAAEAGAAAAEGGAQQLLLTHLAGGDRHECAEAATRAGAADVVAAVPGMHLRL